jgi:hypothetical protein
VSGAKRYGSCARYQFQAMIWRPDGMVALDAIDHGVGPTQGSYEYSLPKDINEQNVVVGIHGSGNSCAEDESQSEQVPVTDHFFRWEESGLVDLGTLGTQGRPLDIQINNQGALAFSTVDYDRSSGTITSVYRTYIREPGGAQREIDALSGIKAFTDSGMIGGCAELGSGTETPVVWSADAGLRQLDPAGRRGCVEDMNESGTAIGRLASDMPFLYHNRTLYDLRDLVPDDVRDRIGSPQAINDAGEILASIDGIGPVVLQPAE